MIDKKAMKTHIMERMGWTDSTFDKVDWPALGAALSSFNNSHQVTLVKHCNNILPIGRMLVHRDDKENPCCMSCNQGVEESFKHMLNCPAHLEKLRSIRTNLEKSLVALGTPAVLCSTLLCQAFDKEDCPQRVVREVREDCIAIGQLEMWRGRVPRSASTAFLSMVRERDAGEVETTAGQWAKGAAKALLRAALDIWWFRNRQRHGNDKEEEAAFQRRKALERCRALSARVTRLKHNANFFMATERLEKWHTGMILHYLSWAEDLCQK